MGGSRDLDRSFFCHSVPQRGVAFSLTFAAVFGKKKKPMPDMPENATGAAASWPASANAAESEEMLRANEAAAEHSTADPDNALVQELEKLKQENVSLNDKHMRLLAEFEILEAKADCIHAEEMLARAAWDLRK